MVALRFVRPLVQGSAQLFAYVTDVAARQSLAQAVVIAQAATDKTPPFQRLSPINQLRYVMGLFVIIILGIFLFIVIKAGSHMVRGMSAKANRLPHSSLPNEDDWAKKALNERPETGGMDGVHRDVARGEGD